MSEQSAQVPTHLGLILDGNRRWAKAQGLSPFEGHKKGYENLKTIGKAALKRGVRYVSAYVFSTENWKRSSDEVNYLMRLLLWVAKTEVKELDKENIKVIFAGSRERLSKPVLSAIDQAEKRTQNNSGGSLVLCLNYGGHEEIKSAVNKLLAENPNLTSITEQQIEQNLYAPDVPPVDLLIRTSGEQRLSNFMLWRAAYSELYFVKKHWPDFTVADLEDALTDYNQRHRRFGGN